jgi:hypothetical protein
MFDTLTLLYCAFYVTWHVGSWKTSFYYRGKSFRWVPRRYLIGSNQVRQQHAPTFHPLLFPLLPSQRGIFFKLPCSLIYIPIESCHTTYADDCLMLVTIYVADKVALVKNNFLFLGKILSKVLYAATIDVSVSFAGIYPEIFNFIYLYWRNAEIILLKFRRCTTPRTLTVSCCSSHFKIFSFLFLLNAEKSSFQWFWCHFYTSFCQRMA